MSTYSIYKTYTNKLAMLGTFKNKAAAIQTARELAVKEKESMTIVREEDDYAIAICEFPYYLRNLKITTKDIYVNRLDQ